MNIYWLKNSGKIGEKSITKNSENFNESTKFSTKMSLKLVKIGWIHQNLHKFCRKSSWAPIWKIVMHWRKKNGKDYQHLKTKIVKCCQNFFFIFFPQLSNIFKKCQTCPKFSALAKYVKIVKNQKSWRVSIIVNIVKNC